MTASFNLNLIHRTLKNRYRVERELGSGGLVHVFLAEDLAMHCKVVVKVPKPTLLAQPEIREHFAQEIDSLASLEHPRIVTVLDQGEVDGTPFFVLRYVAGGNLRERMSRAMSPKELLPWLEPVARALSFLHDRSVVHCHVTPCNILFDENDSVFLADLGIAKLQGLAAPGITRKEQAFGSPAYMAPESRGEDPLGPAYDQYSLGVIVYEALTRRLPYPGENEVDLHSRKPHHPPPPLRFPTLVAEGGLEDVIQRSLAHHPRDRFESCADFAAAFRHAAGASSKERTPAPAGSPTVQEDSGSRPLGSQIPGPGTMTNDVTILPARGPKPTSRHLRYVWLAAVGLLGIAMLVTWKSDLLQGRGIRRLFSIAFQSLGSGDQAKAQIESDHAAVDDRSEHPQAGQVEITGLAPDGRLWVNNRKIVVRGKVNGHSSPSGWIGIEILSGEQTVVGPIRARLRSGEFSELLELPEPDEQLELRLVAASGSGDPVETLASCPLIIDRSPPLVSGTANLKSAPYLDAADEAVTINLSFSETVKILSVDRRTHYGTLIFRTTGGRAQSQELSIPLPQPVLATTRPITIDVEFLAVDLAGNARRVAVGVPVVLNGLVPPSRLPPEARQVRGFLFLAINDQGRAEYVHERTGMVFVHIPACQKFSIGSSATDVHRDEDENPRQVNLSEFLLAKYECTQEVWFRLMEDNASLYPGGNRPVESISWIEAQEFCKRAELRLPTEAEWEYACRTQGTPDAKHPFGGVHSLNNADDHGTYPVGSLEPNSWGLHDMLGNVWEWCRDPYSAILSTTSTAAEPDDQATRVQRGGSITSPTRVLRPPNRSFWQPGSGNKDLGFRPAASLL